MKPLLIFLFALRCFLATATAAEGDVLLQYQSLMSELFNSMTPEQKREPALAPAEWRKSKEYQSLVEMSPSVWRQAIQNLDQIAPSQPQRTVVFQSFEGLQASDYMEFLNIALDFLRQNKINSVEFQGIFMPPGRMQFFLSYNYDNPEVASFLNRVQQARGLLPEGMSPIVSEYLSGKMKQRHIAMRKNHPEIFANSRVPLLSGGYAPPDSEPSLAPNPMEAPLRDMQPKQYPQTAETQTISEESASFGFAILSIAILGAIVIGAAVYFFRRKPIE